MSGEKKRREWASAADGVYLNGTRKSPHFVVKCIHELTEENERLEAEVDVAYESGNQACIAQHEVQERLDARIAALTRRVEELERLIERDNRRHLTTIERLQKRVEEYVKLLECWLLRGMMYPDDEKSLHEDTRKALAQRSEPVACKHVWTDFRDGTVPCEKCEDEQHSEPAGGEKEGGEE